MSNPNIIERNRNRYARLVEDYIQNNGNSREGLDHFNEIFNLTEKGAEIRYLENPETNSVYCESREIISQTGLGAGFRGD